MTAPRLPLLAVLGALLFAALLMPTTNALNVRGGVAAKASAGLKKKQAMGRFGRMGAASRRSTLSAEDKEATPSERRFWLNEWQKVEAEFFQLIGAFGGKSRKVRPVGATEMQLVQTNGRVTPGKKEPESKSPGKANESPKKKPDQSTPKEGTPSLPAADSPVSKAMLAPMLGMLKSTYEDAKARIGRLNAQEKKEKEDFAKRETEHQQKMQKLEAAHQHRLQQLQHAGNGTRSAAAAAADDQLYKNETKWEDHLFSYRQRSRERQHKQFHNMLKITHGMMEKEKEMIKSYEAALSGKVPSAKEAKASLQKMAAEEGMPEVVLLQAQQKDTLGFWEDGLQEVRRAIRHLAF